MKKVKAIFRGRNGSCGFITAREYEFNIAWQPKNHDIKEPIHILQWCDDCQTHHTRVAYESIISFLNNWDNIRIVH